MTKFKTILLGIVGRIKKMATYWTAIGAMAIPLAVIILIEAPNGFSSFWSWIALCLIVLGIISILVGWKNTLAEEKQRRREGIVSLYVLASIAEKLGVNIDEAIEKVRGITGEK